MTSGVAAQITHPDMSGDRLLYLDHLRVLLISLIVLLHLAITYGAPGSWYVREIETATLSMASMIVFTMYNATVQAFALGFFFFLSGYFTASSLERKGPRLFLKDRLVRLGIPLVAYTFALNPVTVYLLYYRPESFSTFLHDHFTGWQFSTGPMWFVAALLLFTLIYILLRAIPTTVRTTVTSQSTLPRLPLLFMLVVVTGSAAFIIRLIFRAGWTVPVLNFQLGYFAEYIVTFSLGIAAWRTRWFDRLAAYRTPVWLAYTAVVVALLPVMLVTSGAEGGTAPFMGGMHWQAFAYAVWEPFVCIGMIIGLSSLFARRLDENGRVFGMLAPNSYAVYVIHPQAVIALTAACAGIGLPPLAKFTVMAPVVLAASFITAMAVRSIPGMKRML